MGNSPKLRFAIDTGGTFTDIVVLDEDTGAFYLEKSPSTPENTLIGILNVIEKAKLDLPSVESFFVHGSTTAMNCLLERKGARTAYVTTSGFRDVPEIARYDRPELYNIKYKRTPPPVPRDLAFEVTERLDYKGDVLTGLDEDDVKKIAAILKKKDIEAVAVCFLHAFKNPAHEKKTKEILLEECPGISVSISSDIVKEHREYERSITTILDAYLKSTIQAWIRNLESELASRKFAGRLIITKSDGGGMTGDLAVENPIHTLLSGPSGGVTGGLFLANHLEHKNLVTLDMGGTSCDICVIKDGLATVKREARIDEWRLLLSTMNISTIGAGGGSIAWLDRAGALQVGPQSAGASPGPMCYPDGGAKPTVTDAALSIGYIDPDNFLGGDIPLNLARARAGIEAQIATPLAMDLPTAARGVLRLAVSNMAEAIRATTIHDGEDVRDFELLCYGGAGPLLAAYLLDDLEMQSAIVPIAPANFSAWGMLTIDIRHNFSQTIAESLDGLDLGDIEAKFAALIKQGEETLAAEGVAAKDRTILRTLDMRYADQEHTVDVAVDFAIAIEEGGSDKIYEAFTTRYKQVWGYALEGQSATIVNLRVVAMGKVPKPKLKTLESGTGEPDEALKGNRTAFSLLDGRAEDHRVYERARLRAADVVKGPAIVEEPTSVTIIPEGFRSEVDPVGNLIIKKFAS